MKMNNLTRIFSLLLLTTLFIASCKKENSNSGTPAEQEEFASAASESDAEAEGVFDDVFNNVMGVNSEVAIGGTGVFGGANHHLPGQEIVGGAAGLDSTHCWTVSITNLNQGSVFPIKVVIDFGTGCTGRDGRTRKGKIIVVYSNRLIYPGATATTTFDGYYVNDIHVEGTHKAINQSTQDKIAFQIIVTDAKLSKPNGNFTEWNSEKTIEQIEGLGTPFVPVDDVFRVSGAANGAVKRGDKFFQWATILSEPLIKKFSCKWIVQGVITLKKSNTAVAVLNYGTGGCDDKATLTVNGHTLEITLH